MLNLISQNFHMIISVVMLSIVLLFSMRWFAPKISLLDIPNKRKFHQNQTPAIGGISIFIATFLTVFIFFDTISIELFSFFTCAGCMLALGVVDDKFDLPAPKKLFFQTLIALTFIIVTGHDIDDLGTPLPFSSSLELGLFSIPFTLFAIVGLTNAFNMIDGCDGLASSLTIISLLALLIFEVAGLNDFNQLLLVVISSLIVFLFFNFSNNKSIKIFLGDGGSLFLGFVVATSLIKFVSKNSLYDPSIVLWFSAVVIFDFCAVIVIRKIKKRKLFAADRNHIHHMLLFSGLSHFQSTATISVSAALILLFGVIVTKNHPYVSFWLFLALSLLYISFRIFFRKAE